MEGKRIKIASSIIFGLIFTVFIFGAITTLAKPNTTASTLISYQGFLTGSNGNPITGTVNLQFNLYATETSTSTLWAETQNSVPVSEGYFSVMLGSVTPLSATDFSGSERWLQVTVDGTAMPRQQFASVPYALQAENAATADAAPWSGITGIPTGFADGVDDTGADGWRLTGNSGTTASNVLGTTDAQTLTMVVSNTTAMRFTSGIDALTGINIPNIIGGYYQNSIADGVFGAVIAGGGGDDSGSPAPNRIADSFGTISGGKANSAGGILTTIGGGGYNTINNNSNYSTIGGGDTNIISGTYSIIGGGQSNLVTATYGSIVGGYNNQVHNYSGFVGGGNGNTANGPGATIGGGSSNTTSNTFTTISGGANSTASGYATTVGGGTSNNAGGSSTTIGGGSNNTASNTYVTISGGANSTASGYAATVGGGTNNNAGSVDGDRYAVIGGGDHNSISGGYDSTIGGGGYNQITADHSTIGGGYANVISGTYSTIPGGYQAQTTHYGELAHANGNFTNPGDAQASTYILRGVTMLANSNTTELYLDGNSQQLTIANNRAVTFDIQVVAINADSNSAASYHIVGGVKNYAGTTALLGTLKVDAFEDDTTWDVLVGVDNVNNALTINVTGPTSGNAVLWVATVRTTETAF